jgi:magnesium chelatase family protein
MSLATIRSFAFSGIEAVPVEVQVQIASGLPAFLMVWPVTHSCDRGLLDVTTFKMEASVVRLPPTPVTAQLRPRP